jgi:molybdopterin-guanine dinucleotide biosynthesis protein A
VFAGAVLCGGASQRMGRDKALISIDGRALAARVADTLEAAGAVRVLAVGGDLAGLRAAGLDAVPDEAPGAGPLTGIVTALGLLAPCPPGPAPDPVTDIDMVFAAACDLVAPDPGAVRQTLAALAAAGSADVAVPVVNARRQWLHAAWRAPARPPLAAAFAAGERSVHGAVALAGLRVVELELAPRHVADADTPHDLPGPAGDGGQGPGR